MEKKLAAAGYLKLFRNFKLARMIKTYRTVSCHQVLKIRECYIYSVISKIIKQYFDIKLSKDMLAPNPVWNFCRHITSYVTIQGAFNKKCVHSVSWGVSQ